jgi:hypothetical protein
MTAGRSPSIDESHEGPAADEMERLWQELRSQERQLITLGERVAAIEAAPSNPPQAIEVAGQRGRVRGPAWAVVLLVAMGVLMLLLSRFHELLQLWR